MDRKIKKAFDTMKPTKIQKQRIYNSTMGLKGNMNQKINRIRLKKIQTYLVKIAASIFIVLSLGIVVNAATGGWLFEEIERIIFDGGGEVLYKKDGNHITTYQKEMKSN